MRLICLNQFAPPDPAPTGLYLHDLATALAQSGNEVIWIASQRSYGSEPLVSSCSHDHSVLAYHLRKVGRPGKARGGFARIFAWIEYLVATLWVGMRQPRPDAIIVLTTPPWLGLLAQLLGRFHSCPVIHWVMDVYPDALVAHGSMADHGPIWDLLLRLSRAQHTHRDRVVALGDCMASRLRRSWNVEALVVPLWVRDELRIELKVSTHPGPEISAVNPEPLRLLYSGNLGQGHPIEDFLAAARLIGVDGPRWNFSGKGPRRAAVAACLAAHPSLPITLTDPVPAEQLATHLASADLHLVGVRNGWEGVIVPSKIQAIFAAGLPVLVIAPFNSEAAQWTLAAGAGWVVAPGDHSGVIQALAEAGDAARRAACGARAKRFSEQHFDRRHNVALLTGIICEAVYGVRTSSPQPGPSSVN